MIPVDRISTDVNYSKKSSSNNQFLKLHVCSGWKSFISESQVKLEERLGHYIMQYFLLCSLLTIYTNTSYFTRPEYSHWIFCLSLKLETYLDSFFSDRKKMLSLVSCLALKCLEKRKRHSQNSDHAASLLVILVLLSFLWITVRQFLLIWDDTKIEPLANINLSCRTDLINWYSC